MADTVPSQAAEWIVSYLVEIGQGLSPEMSEVFRHKCSLNLVTVKQLKLIWKGVDKAWRTLGASAPANKPASGANKDAWIHCIRRTFYTSNSCTVSNKSFLTLLKKKNTPVALGTVQTPMSFGRKPSKTPRFSSLSRTPVAASAQRRSELLDFNVVRGTPTSTTSRKKAYGSTPTLVERKQSTPRFSSSPRTQVAGSAQWRGDASVARGTPTLVGKKHRRTAVRALRKISDEMDTLSSKKRSASSPPKSSLVNKKQKTNTQPSSQTAQLRRSPMNGSSRIGVPKHSKPSTMPSGGPQQFLSHSSRAHPMMHAIPPMRYPRVGMTTTTTVAAMPFAPPCAPMWNSNNNPFVPLPTPHQSMWHNHDNASSDNSSSVDSNNDNHGPSPVKTEGVPANYDTHPQTPQEAAMANALRQMGFTDVGEMLMGIRHVSSSDSSDIMSQAEQAMMWIVSQREEAEEARKLDAARLRSEATRMERAEERAKEARQQLLDASMDNLVKDFFVGSVLLEQSRRCMELLPRPSVIRLLQLEKSAYKWYGRVVPWCYFCALSKTLNKSIKKANELQRKMQSESDQLEKILYSLSEQQGGVPRLFLDAQKNAKTKGLPQGPEPLIGDGDDDVVVLEEGDLENVSSNGNHNSSCSSNSSNNNKSSGRTEPSSQDVEVVELS